MQENVCRIFVIRFRSYSSLEMKASFSAFCTLDLNWTNVQNLPQLNVYKLFPVMFTQFSFLQENYNNVNWYYKNT